MVDIRRGITCAETELKAGESKRIVPFSTNTSKARNNILHHIVFKGIRFESNLNDISSHFQDDDENNRSDDSNDNESTTSAESIDRMYEDGLDMNQFNFLTNI